VYCAAVLDVFSPRVVGWSIDSTPTAALVTNALGMAIGQRDPSNGTVIHSDQGTQGELNRSSQHLDRGGVRGWRRCGSDGGRFSCIGGRCRRRVGRPDAGVVDQHVDPAEPGDRGVDDGLDLVAIRDVESPRLADGPTRDILAASSATAAWSMSQAATTWPSAASSCTIAAPMPRAAPVTTTTRAGSSVTIDPRRSAVSGSRAAGAWKAPSSPSTTCLFPPRRVGWREPRDACHMSFLVHAAGGIQPHAEANATLVEPDTARTVQPGAASRVTFVAPGRLTAERFGLFRYEMMPRTGGPSPHLHTGFQGMAGSRTARDTTASSYRRDPLASAHTRRWALAVPCARRPYTRGAARDDQPDGPNCRPGRPSVRQRRDGMVDTRALQRRKGRDLPIHVGQGPGGSRRTSGSRLSPTFSQTGACPMPWLAPLTSTFLSVVVSGYRSHRLWGPRVLNASGHCRR
jgi:Integrase core domain